MEIEFEGSEKKLEITFKRGFDLLARPEEQMLALVQEANTQVLSKIENEKVRAYLLSESSLFVWNDRFTMITCGTTTLVQAAIFAVQTFGDENIEALIYQRKNEYFPQKQKTNFYDDIDVLNQVIEGSSMRMGAADEHHLFLFHSERKFQPHQNDTTLEVLMYDIQGKSNEVFNTQGLAKETILRETGVDKIMAGFTVDSFAFEPIGFSLNAIKGRHYFTVHVTPQEVSPYVSFETNLTSRAEIQKTLNSVLEVFRPRSFDVVYFDTGQEAEVLETTGYDRRSHVRANIDAGYCVHFGHFSEPWKLESKPFAIKKSEKK